MSRHWIVAAALAAVGTLAPACSGSEQDEPTGTTDAAVEGECEGCIDSTGSCVSGSAVTACGRAGDSCAVCDDGQICPAGECVSPPACGPDTCTGCCDQDGQCQASSNAACGEGGGACAVCEDGSSCSLGTCVADSCAASCAGCCSGDSCLGGDLDAACGSGGDACVDCGSARECTGGACTVDPASRWDVVVVSATVAERDVANATWDPFGGLPDPYVVIRAADGPDMADGESEFVSNTLAPTWNQVVMSDVPARLLLGSFEVSVFDDDTIADQQIGKCNVTVADPLFSDILLESTCARNVDQGQAGFTIRFRLRPTE